jgi:hypothetical protein
MVGCSPHPYKMWTAVLLAQQAPSLQPPVRHLSLMVGQIPPTKTTAWCPVLTASRCCVQPGQQCQSQTLAHDGNSNDMHVSMPTYGFQEQRRRQCKEALQVPHASVVGTSSTKADVTRQQTTAAKWHRHTVTCIDSISTCMTVRCHDALQRCSAL